MILFSKVQVVTELDISHPNGPSYFSWEINGILKLYCEIFYTNSYDVGCLIFYLKYISSELFVLQNKSLLNTQIFI